MAQPVLLNYSAELLRSIVCDSGGRVGSVGQFFKGTDSSSCAVRNVLGFRAHQERIPPEQVKALFQEVLNLDALSEWYREGSGWELACLGFLPLYVSVTSKPNR